MTTETHRIKIELDIWFAGTLDEARGLVFDLDDKIEEWLPINCGEIECCPIPPDGPHVWTAVASSTIDPPEEDNEETEEKEIYDNL